MSLYVHPVQIRWSDLDPNFHLRHSVYYDWGALCRIEFLKANGLTTTVMQRLHFGPILFREECTFRKEIKYGDKISISLSLSKSRKDFSRWTIMHQIMKDDNIVCATLIVDGAWMHIIERKLFIPPGEVINVFGQMPRDESFEWS